MDWILLQPGSVIALTQVLLLFVVAFYLLSIKHKTRGTWLLAIAFGVLGLAWLLFGLAPSLYTALPFQTDPLDELMIPFFLYVLLHFAYNSIIKFFQVDEMASSTLVCSLFMRRPYTSDSALAQDDPASVRPCASSRR